MPFTDALSRAYKSRYLQVESKTQLTDLVTEIPPLYLPLLRQEFPVGSATPALRHGNRALRHDHIRFMVVRKLDGYNNTEIARDLLPYLPYDKPAAHRVRSALRKLEKDASLFRTVGIVEPVVVTDRGDRLFYCLIHGEAFDKASDASNHCWVTLFVELVDD